MTERHNNEMHLTSAAHVDGRSQVISVLCRPNGAREVRDGTARPLLEAPEPPTLLAPLCIPEPKEMTGYDLRK